MLVCMTEQEVDSIIAKWGLEKRTPNTITDPEKLKKDLAKYKELGYAVDNEEESPNNKCLGMAIMSPDGLVAGALSICGSPLTMPDSKFSEYTRLLSGACKFLSQYAHLFPAIQLHKWEI
jgi:DNA-binding IclR family transcriptional regulator